MQFQRINTVQQSAPGKISYKFTLIYLCKTVDQNIYICVYILKIPYKQFNSFFHPPKIVLVNFFSLICNSFCLLTLLQE